MDEDYAVAVNEKDFEEVNGYHSKAFSRTLQHTVPTVALVLYFAAPSCKSASV